MTNIIITLPINPKKQVHVEKYLKDGLVNKLNLKSFILIIYNNHIHIFIENNTNIND